MSIVGRGLGIDDGTIVASGLGIRQAVAAVVAVSKNALLGNVFQSRIPDDIAARLGIEQPARVAADLGDRVKPQFARRSGRGQPARSSGHGPRRGGNVFRRR
jgi:hypothetical protein